MKKVLFLGDSITDVGRCLTSFEWILGGGYPTLVSAELGFEYPNEYDFINRGIAGNRVVDLYARIKRDVINMKPDVLSILIGANDVWHDLDGQENGVDAEKYYKVYCMMIEELKESNPDMQILILEPFALKGFNTEEHWDVFSDEIEKRAEMSKLVAEKYGLKFVPLKEKFKEAEKISAADRWLVDGVHPTTRGHELIKREWIKAFKEI